MELTPTISKLITKRGSHLRGELKTKMKDTVDLIYGFKSGQNKKTITYNRQLAQSLKKTFKLNSQILSLAMRALLDEVVNGIGQTLGVPSRSQRSASGGRRGSARSCARHGKRTELHQNHSTPVSAAYLADEFTVKTVLNVDGLGLHELRAPGDAART
ncbi:hypothetical protein B0H14DRAFT_3870288 [Mycena olivaceomarginata]|nr:hypothetical protein B0H14DRAFT_3870288 [Mycena olivaceomarginata]